ncbi:MAG: UDP-N-acetylmuramoyl-L-alanyl-D-glutamate--2,6-diaminopimelate ligase [Simkaniaceae bacterium]|nr:UDP-N-acetylmuramoyl-L-alanyl-D-glutamate--2,6-diaminopimelate ligase [Simkaniaceae bacterium]
MKLKYLIKGLPVEIRGPKEIEITGISEHSKLTSPGNLFIAKREGVRYIGDALRGGAIAVLTDIFNPFHKVTQLITSDIPLVECKLAERFYEVPKGKLFTIGITGTNGKTTTSFLIRHFIETCGLIGTIEVIIGGHHLPAELTTPDTVSLQKMLYEMVRAHETAAVMEVSSHSLDQGRVRGVNFDLGIYTNLTQDHLDYHGNMEQYKAAKLKLSTQSKKVIVNRDSSFGLDGITYGIEGPADYRAEEIKLSAEGLSFSLQGVRFTSRLIGRFNIYNCLAAIAAGREYGLSLEVLRDRLALFPGVPGRLERVPHARGAHVFVDYAHTDDALRNVLSALTELKKGKIITVFGCGGDRDREKRPKMAMAVEAYSDEVIVTSDNPRSEDPLDICQQVVAGFSKKAHYCVEPERRKAIHQAVLQANPGDIVLIAGKGHETKQLIGGRTIDFDDRKVAIEV